MSLHEFFSHTLNSFSYITYFMSNYKILRITLFSPKPGQDAPVIHAGRNGRSLFGAEVRGCSTICSFTCFPYFPCRCISDTIGWMKTVITAKLKLHTTPEQFAALRATQLAYRDSLNYVSQYAFEHGKMSNRVALQGGTYDEVRARFHLPSQMACSVPRQVGATYKALWTKVKQNAAQRKAGLTSKRYKGLDQAPKYVSPILTYQYKKDYSFKEDQHLSILTLQGRVIVPYTGKDSHVALLQHGAQIGAAKLWYDKPTKQFYLP